eukprot:TRINITY_DN10310_c0_g2_i1.p1 TRINITY_DN10310_c0_g2~~TRINITY_DN10310_c0_g2_i1.p1  ORF type:complete len:201 (-),score=7.81 TRINITY_DN10310_c0_g2_i1:36-638(-)
MDINWKRIDLPILCIPLLLWGITILTSRPSSKSRQISRKERWVANWFLFNGSIIHIFLDGLVGLVGRVPFLNSMYSELDKRYSAKDGTVMVISILELIFMGPQCLLLYYAIQNNKSWRYPLQIVVSVTQGVGCLIFAGSEILNGFKNVPADLDFTFSTDSIIYFWILFVFANLLWVIVPLYLTIDAWKKITHLMVRKKNR